MAICGSRFRAAARRRKRCASPIGTSNGRARQRRAHARGEASGVARSRAPRARRGASCRRSCCARRAPRPGRPPRHDPQPAIALGLVLVDAATSRSTSGSADAAATSASTSSIHELMHMRQAEPLDPLLAARRSRVSRLSRSGALAQEARRFAVLGGLRLSGMWAVGVFESGRRRSDPDGVASFPTETG